MVGVWEFEVLYDGVNGGSNFGGVWIICFMLVSLVIESCGYLWLIYFGW